MRQRRTVVSVPGRGPGSWSWWWSTLTTAAVVVGAATITRAQAQTPPVRAARDQPGSSVVPPAPKQVGDLTTRFRLIERYAGDAAKPQAGEIGQYRVASRDVIRMVVEKPQGAPDRSERTVQIIYTERPALVNSSGVVTDTVRKYETFRVSPKPETTPSAPTPLEGLTVWNKPLTGGSPLMLALTPNHPLSETEYSIHRQLMYLPDLSTVLPALPSHAGDQWRVPRSATVALMGGRPMQQQQGEPLVATLLDVHKAATGTGMVALIGVTGRAPMPPTGADTVINAQVSFTFTPSTTAPATATGEGASATATATATGIVEGRGVITEVRSARSSTSAVPGTNGRLRQTLTWEQILERQNPAPGELLPAPVPPPAATEQNSWLTYDDAKGRFHFRHPQELLPQMSPLLDKEDVIQLLDNKAGPNEGRFLRLKLQAKTGNAETDRQNVDPELQKKALEDEWARTRQDVLRGPRAWLPEADWAPYKMKVYRIEAALKPSGVAGKDVSRIFLDHYLVVFTQNESLVVDAVTGQDPPLPFRKQVEDILKTFQLGPSAKPGGP
jgi:hypothetical protein